MAGVHILLLLLGLGLTFDLTESAVCEESTLDGYQCQQHLSGEYTLHWIVKGYTVKFASVVQTADANGFVGLGFSSTPSMADAYVVASDDNDVNPYTTASGSAHSLLPNEGLQTIKATSIKREGGEITMEFTRCVSNGSPLDLNLAGSNTIIWAFNPKNDSPSYHSGNRGVSTVDLSLTPDEGTPVDGVDDGTCACTASSMEDYECTAAMDVDGVNVHWAVEGKKVKFSLKVEGDTGYISLGFPETAEKMIGSDAVITTNGEALAYKLGGKSAAKVVLDDAAQITGASVTREDGVATTLMFTRCLDNGGARVLDLTTTDIVWAYHPDKTVLVPDEYHGYASRGWGLLDLSLTSDNRPLNGTDDGSCDPPPTDDNATDDNATDDNASTDDNDDDADGNHCDTASTRPGFDCEATLKDGAYVVHWGVSADRNSVKFACSVKTAGFVGFGFSRSGVMENTDAVIGSAANGVSTYTLTSTATPDSSQRLFDQSAEYDADTGMTTMFFSRDLDNGGQSVITLDGFTKVVWAYSASDSPTVEYHYENKGTHEINFDTGASGSTSQFNFVLLHGVFMVVAWAFLAPMGVLMARFGKPLGDIWFQFHRGIQVMALLFALAGLIVALVKFDGMGGSHRTLGATVLAIGFSQPLNAFFRPHVGTANRPKWNVLHHWFGRGAVVMAFVNMFLGLKKAEDSDGMLDSYKILRVFLYVGLCGCAAVGVVLEIKNSLATRNGSDTPYQQHQSNASV